MKGQIEIASLVADRICESVEVKESVLRSPAMLAMIAKVGVELRRCLHGGRRVYIFGNGGSAADAQHIAAELAGRYLRERPGLPCIALTTNTSTLTAIGNDYSYDAVFSRQLEGLACRGDVVIGISTSGNSGNVIRALEYAKSKGTRTVALTGRSGGKLKAIADYCLCVPSEATPRIQEVHILLGHILCEIAEEPYVGAKQKSATASIRKTRKR